MPELVRTRDVVAQFKGDAITVAVSPAMISGGWVGGQGVQWTSAPTDDFMVTYSDGRYGGFLLWGSNEDSDQYVSFYRQQVTYGHAVLCFGGWLISTSSFEQYTYASRIAGPLVPIVYTAGQRLLFSLRGLFTNEDEWTASLDPRRPNGFYIGNVVMPPVLNERGIPFLSVQTSL
jgi:hypothetical protein